MSTTGLDLADYEAVLFDLDGVITPTAEVHMRAWHRMFSDFLESRGAGEPYVEQDYFDHIDGKPRYDGVRSFLASRGITLPDGEPTDPPTAETVCGLGNKKNDAFAGVLADEGVAPYPGSLQLLDRLIDQGIKVGLVSSSRNAGVVLAAAGLEGRFPVVVDGLVAARDGLPGKPSGATYVAAAERLGANPEHSVVVEDAISGVQAGRDGRFGLVVGVDRGVGADRLLEAGADIVVADLAEFVGHPAN